MSYPVSTPVNDPPSTVHRVIRAVLAVVVVALGLSACGSPPVPTITFFADRESVVSRPVLYCPLDFKNCDPAGTAADLAVPPGRPLQISLPPEIADAPWRLITIYVDGAGKQQSRDRFYKPGERLAVTLRLGPGELLQGVEIQLPSGATDQDGNPVARAAWALQNTYSA